MLFGKKKKCFVHILCTSSFDVGSDEAFRYVVDRVYPNKVPKSHEIVMFFCLHKDAEQSWLQFCRGKWRVKFAN